MPQIKVLIADDDAILRAGLKLLINAQTDMEVVSEAPDGTHAVRAARDTRPAWASWISPCLARAACGRSRKLFDIVEPPTRARDGLAAGASGCVETGGLPARTLSLLSERELQVLGLIAQGYGSQNIATRIVLSAKIIETYRSRIAEKLRLRSRSDIVRFALEMGLLTSERLVRDPA